MLALRFVSAVGDPSIHLYPSEISATQWYQWAVRVDGLQIGIVGAELGTLTVGKPGKDGVESSQRRDFIAVFGSERVIFAENPDTSAGQIRRAGSRPIGSSPAQSLAARALYPALRSHTEVSSTSTRPRRGC